jgi:hypothetical protein
VALMVTELTPATVGVPLMAPVDAFTLRPGGRPVAPKLVGEPSAVMVYVKATPLVAVTANELVIVGLPVVDWIAMVRFALPVPPALEADRETEVEPEAVGVPLITPVAVLIDNPAGSPVALYEVGELLAVML